MISAWVHRVVIRLYWPGGKIMNELKRGMEIEKRLASLDTNIERLMQEVKNIQSMLEGSPPVMYVGPKDL